MFCWPRHAAFLIGAVKSPPVRAVKKNAPLLAPLRVGWASTSLVCSPVASKPPTPGQTSGQRVGAVDKKTGLPRDPTRPAAPPLRSPHPPLRSASKGSLPCRIGLPETAESFHYRGNSVQLESRSGKFSADSGQDLEMGEGWQVVCLRLFYARRYSRRVLLTGPTPSRHW
jgi:hypothetical protein